MHKSYIKNGMKTLFKIFHLARYILRMAHLGRVLWVPNLEERRCVGAFDLCQKFVWMLLCIYVKNPWIGLGIYFHFKIT